MLNYDCVLVSAPALISALAGHTFAKLEQRNNIPSKCLGFFGLRICVITFHLTSFLTTIYAVFKSCVLTILNILSFNKISCLRTSKIKTDVFLSEIFGANIKKKPASAIA